MRPPLCQCFTAAVVHSKTSDLCTLNRALEGILPCLFSNSLQHKQQFDHFCTFSPKLFQSTTPTFFPVAMLSNPSSYLSPGLQHCFTLSLSSFSPIPNLGHICYSGTPVSSGLEGLLTSSLTPSLLFCL